jgi:hypothetical protein
MTEIEERIRAAVHAAGETVADGSAPPLRLGLGTSRAWAPHWTARLDRGRVRFLVPAAAAVAVLAVVAAAVAIAALPGRPSRPNSDFGGMLPPYYLTFNSQEVTIPPRHFRTYVSRIAIIKSTSTGARVAVARAPLGAIFVAATGASDDRSFVLAVRPASNLLKPAAATLYRAQFSPGRRALRLAPLPIHAFSGLTDIAMAPGGNELAVAVQTGRNSGQLQIRLYSLTGRLIKTWEDPGSLIGPYPGNNAISWSAAGTLAITWIWRDSNGVWLLNTSAPGGSLAAHSRLVIPGHDSQQAKFHLLGPGVLSGNGQTITAATIRVPQLKGKRVVYPAIGGEFQQISARTGREIRALWPVHIANESAIWSNWSGSAVLVLANLTSGPKSTSRAAYGVLTRNGFTPLTRGPNPSRPAPSPVF